ncbi:MAG: exodeoxyribonuclease III [Alphaproteobacteria bacterium]|nr:exodeoxyribonuclease III [Alphaproteobacteria bacterium]
MKIATLNINSINARLPLLMQWLKKNDPDVLLLQEIKTQYNDFPFFEINAAGYNACLVGQKGYNGVAVLSKNKIDVCREKLPGFSADEARYLEAQIGEVLVASVYMPNGNPVGSANYEKKLQFMDAFYAHVKKMKMQNDKIVLGGDFNVILSAQDVYNPDAFRQDALFQSEVQKRLKAVEYLGFYDAYRVLNPAMSGYTYWDYGSVAFANDFGLRIDYLMCSPLMIEKLKTCVPDKSLRAEQKPSDHTALVATFEI